MQNIALYPVLVKGKKNIAKIMSVSTRTIEQWMREGMPYANHNGRVDIELNAVMRWRQEKTRI